MLPWWSCGITEALMFNCLTFLLGTLWKQTKDASHSETPNQVFAIKNEALWSVLCLTALKCHRSTLEQRFSRASRTFPWKTCLCQQGWKMISAVPILTWDATWKDHQKKVWYLITITSNYSNYIHLFTLIPWSINTGIHIDWSWLIIACPCWFLTLHPFLTVRNRPPSASRPRRRWSGCCAGPDWNHPKMLAEMECVSQRHFEVCCGLWYRYRYIDI